MPSADLKGLKKLDSGIFLTRFNAPREKHNVYRTILEYLIRNRNEIILLG